MALKYILTIRSSSSPHLYLDQIKKMIKDDDELLPQTRKMLVLLKKFNKPYIQIPLQLEIVISPEFECNLERGLSPQLMQFNKTEWSENDKENWENDKEKFLGKIKKLYNEMGYDIKEDQVSDEVVGRIVADVDARIKKFGGNLLDKAVKDQEIKK